MRGPASTCARVDGAGAALLTLGALPFAAGVASNALGLGTAGAPKLVCPMAAATGVPCPFCGASRSFRRAVLGDPAFLTFNPFWVVIAGLMIVAGLTLIVRRRRSREASAHRAPLRLRVAVGAPLGLIVAAVVGGWCVALAHRDAIIG